MAGDQERCGGCGARLFGATWCSLCGADGAHGGEPVGEENFGPLVYVHPPRRPATRWFATPTTFGPAIKIVVTIAVVLFGIHMAEVIRQWQFWEVIFVAGTGYLGLAAIVLRSLWRRAPQQGPGASGKMTPRDR